MELRRMLENDEKEPVYLTEGFVHYPTDNMFPRKKNHGEICVLEKKKKISQNVENEMKWFCLVPEETLREFT